MFELTMAASRRTEFPTCALQLANEVSNLHDIIVTQADTERKVAECRGDRYSARPLPVQLHGTGNVRQIMLTESGHLILNATPGIAHFLTVANLTANAGQD